MRNWLGAFVVMGVGGVLSAACSSTAADKYPTTDSFCAAKAVEECQVVSLCAVDVNACKAKRTDICTAAAAVATSTSRKYTPANAQACIDSVHTLYGSTTGTVIPPAKLEASEEICQHVFSGTVANNAACVSTFDCANTSSICDKGLCGPKVSKSLGDGCANAGEVCTGASFCTKTAPNVCLATKTAGQPCDVANPCSPGLRCDPVSLACSTTFPAGHVCASNADCADAAPFCDIYNGNVCDAGLIFAPSAKALCAQWGGS